MLPSLAVKLHADAIRSSIAKFPVQNPRVFGSTARGTDQEGSDLDIVVDALPGATLFDLGGLQEDLESLLGIPVDVRTPGDLPSTWRDHVVEEAHPL